MVCRTARKALGVIVLGSVLLSPAAQAASWLRLITAQADQGDGLLTTLWRQITQILDQDNDNRGTIDPNG
jgi:hypothetical protein